VPGCAAGIFRQGQWLAKGAYGAADLERRGRITPRTLFYMASVSKQFTAAALLRLVDQGGVALGDDIRKYLPELPQYTPPITIDHLVHHESGLADFLAILNKAGTLGDPHDPGEIIKLIASRETLFPAGKGYSYSNSNYFLIAQIIQRASGKPLREFAHDALFKPLGMADTYYRDDASEIVTLYANGYERLAGGKYAVVKTSYQQVGAGGLLTSVDDLGKWMRIYENPDAIPESPRLGERLQERGKFSDGTLNDYALGLLMGSQGGHVIASHEGFFPGYRAFFAWIPGKRTGLFAMCNSSDVPMTAVANAMVGVALR
jgi:CubicO group peptidase (beta-lactamase class C family)